MHGGLCLRLSFGIYLGIIQGMAWTMRFPEDEGMALDAQARAEGRTKSDIVRDAVRIYILSHRQWEEPFIDDEDTVDLGGPIRKDDIRAAMNRTA